MSIQGRIQDFSYEGVHHQLTDDVKNFKSEYEEEGFWLGNNIMWTAENTYQTIEQILYVCQATAQC